MYIRGQVYNGSWKNDLKNGQGNQTLASGDNYVGGFLNDKLDGEGVYKWKSGHEYSGSWKNGMMNGYGNLTQANGENYVGDFKDNKKDGKGVYTWYREPYRYS